MPGGPGYFMFVAKIKCQKSTFFNVNTFSTLSEALFTNSSMQRSDLQPIFLLSGFIHLSFPAKSLFLFFY